METPQSSTAPLLHTVRNTGTKLSISRTKTYQLINRGILDVVKIDNGTRITDESVRRVAITGTGGGNAAA